MYDAPLSGLDRDNLVELDLTEKRTFHRSGRGDAADDSQLFEFSFPNARQAADQSGWQLPPSPLIAARHCWNV
jgi:hypothetical protein